MYCKTCGNQLVEGAQFCGKCGSKVISVNAGPVQQYSVNQNQAPQSANIYQNQSFVKRKSKKAPLILLVLILIIAFFVYRAIMIKIDGDELGAIGTDQNTSRAITEKDFYSEYYGTSKVNMTSDGDEVLENIFEPISLSAIYVDSDVDKKGNN